MGRDTIGSGHRESPKEPGQMSEHEPTNRSVWNDYAAEYQRINAPQIREQAFSGDIAWGVWGIRESELNVLGDVAGKDILELGCGGGQWSLALARRDALPVGLDLSERQLDHARSLMQEAGISFPVIQASGEKVPFGDATFDIVFADHGAFLFADPFRTVPESARVLRSGGLLVICHMSPMYEMATPIDADHASDRFVYDYFGLYRLPEEDGMIHFNLPYGEWIRLFRQSGLIVEDLIEPRPEPDAVSTYRDADDLAWSRRWSIECIWRARKL
jgi:ubiquinone/menaquinone biosynthesis C-methylase UbiE